MDSYQGRNNDPLTLHKYAYGNGDPVNMVDPSGHFGLASVGAATNIGSILATSSVPNVGISQVFSGGGTDRLSDKQKGALVLLSLSTGSTKQILLHHYRNADKNAVVRTSRQEYQYLQQGKVIDYYASRLARGDMYAKLAIDVVNETGWLGYPANVWLRFQFSLLSESAQQRLLNGGDYNNFSRRVNLELARLHQDKVETDFVGFWGILSASQVSEYHEDYFISLGLPRETFGGSFIFGYRTEYWCVGCDAEP